MIKFFKSYPKELDKSKCPIEASAIQSVYSVGPPDVVPLLVFLAHDADLESVVADGEVAVGQRLLAEVQVYLVLVDGTGEHLGIEHHRGTRSYVVLRGWVLVVVALVIRVVPWRRGGRLTGSPTGVVVIATPTGTDRATAAVHVRFHEWLVAGYRTRLDQGQGRRRASVTRVHRHAVRRVRVLLSVRRKHCKSNFGSGLEMHACIEMI